MDATTARVAIDTCPRCAGFGAAVHPAWADFYRQVELNAFTCQADYQAFWRAQGCPTDLSGHLILPPQETPCACAGAALPAATT